MRFKAKTATEGLYCGLYCKTYPTDEVMNLSREQSLFSSQDKTVAKYSPNAKAVIALGDGLKALKELPNGFVQLIVTSPPYNIGKA